ncbi:ferric reductase transmembrane component 3 [Xylariomycetidae sp. FL2044]|nr:ferric reductase transmembrane component 3 [Xylariomycetidae sp. FL2044]
MDVPDWYALALGSLVASSIFAWLLLSIFPIVKSAVDRQVIKLLAHPRLSTYVHALDRVVTLGTVSLLILLIVNIFALSLHVHTVSEFMYRSGLVSSISLVPLFLGGQMNIIASRCGISLRTYTGMHRWLGRTAILDGLLHAVVALADRSQTKKATISGAAIAAACAFLGILLSGLLRRHWYEIFIYLHLFLVVAATATIYTHMPTHVMDAPARYLLVALCLQIFMGGLRYGQILYRNSWHLMPDHRASIRIISYKQSGRHSISGDGVPSPRADIALSDAVHVHVRLARAWTPRAGQYIYLCVPGASRTSIAQLDPLYVAWWYQESGSTCVVLIVQKQRGFSERLFTHRGGGSSIDGEADSGSQMKAFVEGPYGRELPLDLYGTVLLIASGIGIAGQLSYVAQLLGDYHNGRTKTRRIALLWEVESEIQTAWVADQMQKLLERDTDRILDIHLFVSGNFLSSETNPGDRRQVGERIHMLYNALDIEIIVKAQVEQRKGDMVISLCTDEKTRNEVHKTVRGLINVTVALRELDFRPGQKRKQRRDNQWI